VGSSLLLYGATLHGALGDLTFGALGYTAQAVDAAPTVYPGMTQTGFFPVSFVGSMTSAQPVDVESVSGLEGFATSDLAAQFKQCLTLYTRI